MPWLEKDNDNSNRNNNLLFIHVPRCGGTSLMKSHNVPFKATENSSLFHKLGMKLFFHRYKLLESANFPLWTWGNAACWCMVLLNSYWRFVVLPSNDDNSNSNNNNNNKIYKVIASFNIAFFLTLFFGLTFVFVAPTIGRIIYVRRCFLVLVQYVLMRFMENLEYLTGTNIHGYLPHLTAHKMLHYGYVAPQEMEDVSSLAIVRNPYSRMVSIYMYNRFGSREPFPQFVKSWYTNMKYYRESGEMEEWYTPCHTIPQFEYTHFEGSQLVQSIVKQEELKFLKHRDGLDKYDTDDANGKNSSSSSVRDLPQVVRDALLGMPHANKRKTTKPWYEYYDQDTLNLTYEMYQVDFEIFEYSTSIPQRPDLRPPQISNTLAQSVSSPSRSMSMSMSMATPPPKSSLLSSSSSISTSTTSTNAYDDDPPLMPPPVPAPQPILFESFSRDASSDASSERRRSSLLNKSVRVSARRSSMADSVRNSTRNSLLGGTGGGGGLNASSELSKLLAAYAEDDENDNDNDDGDKKND